MKYIRSCEKYGKVATKRSFMKLIGKSHLDSGYMNTFFCAVKDAGILNSIWLFIAYPLILGFGYIIGDKIYKLLVYLKYIKKSETF